VPQEEGTVAVTLRTLVLVLGDQLDLEASAFDGFDCAQDAVWMAEVREEQTQVWSSQQRSAFFLSAMRHFCAALRGAGRTVHYLALDAPGNPGRLAAALAQAVQQHQPQALCMTAPGDWRVMKALADQAHALGLKLEVREDRHFLCSLAQFGQHAEGRKQLRMEFFYREMRKRLGVLMQASATGGLEPAGGQWNFDADNRDSFGKSGPPFHAPPQRFEPDAITQEVLALVQRELASHPGRVASFGWPVTREQALAALHDFIEHRLPDFGRWQDALWPDEPWLWHAQISAAMNVKLLHPRECIEAAEQAWRSGHAELASVEGFIRQILGWREYVRGIYWMHMPAYAERNALGAQEALPAFYWTGHTPMACLADAIGQTLEHGYAHHIQRLMVTGLYALLLGVRPQAVHEWYLAVYVDAVEWVELPNTLGMSQAGDGGLMASKPYIASGKYIERMSSGSLCARCRFKPAERTGARACPFTTLYWDFLLRHEELLARNPRTVMQVKNLARVSAEDKQAIAAQAAALRAQGGPV
jgi:deoxyribodipyrimidine photolyase-related protein